MKKAFFIGFNALGDTLCTSPTVRAFRKANPDIFITYIVQNAAFCRVLDANPDIDLVIYNEHMYIYGLTRFSNEWFYSLPLDITESSTLYFFDIKRVCSKEESFHEHISTGFSKLLDIPIDSVRPLVYVTPKERQLAKSFVRRPYIIFSMHSNSNPNREDGKGKVKDWPSQRWLTLAKHIQSWGSFDIISIGSENDSQIRAPKILNLYGLPIKLVAALLQDAACVVTLENGLAHLSHAVDAPMVEIYSNIVPQEWAYPKDASCCRIIYNDPQLISCDEVIAALESILSEKSMMP